MRIHRIIECVIFLAGSFVAGVEYQRRRDYQHQVETARMIDDIHIQINHVKDVQTRTDAMNADTRAKIARASAMLKACK